MHKHSKYENKYTEISRNYTSLDPEHDELCNQEFRNNSSKNLNNNF